MAEAAREAWITGIGIVSSLGEGPDAHWQQLMAAQPSADAAILAPFVVHPLASVDFDKQIPKKGDQRQMEPWQRIGTYAAGLALDSADVKGNKDILSRMDMIVAAGGGERDLKVDGTILTGMPKAENPDAFLNERLMSDLRPTLFLAQLSNLLAGNISIVHGVVGSSRTFMGEESAGFDSVRIGLSRIAAGQSDIALVGGGHNSERKEMLMLYEFGGFNLKDKFATVWNRGPAGGFALGSMGAFLVIEARPHAEARGAKPVARLSAVLSDRSNRKPGDAKAAMTRMWETLDPRLDPAHCAIISGATGTEPVTAEEREFLSSRNMPVRATASYTGHGMEANFPMNIAVAAIAVRQGTLFPPDGSDIESPMGGTIKQAVVTGLGHHRGEGLALVEAV